MKPARHKNRITIGVLILLFVVGGAIVIQYVSKLSGKSSISAQSVTRDQLSEAAPADTVVNQYVVAPSNPRFLIIPKLDIKSRVKALSVDKNGKLAAPDNIYDAGWYKSSAKPGSLSGATLIDGHVSGPRKKGIFHDLKTLRADDQLIIERGDGRIINYRVVATESFNKDHVNMAKALTPINPIKPGLNLITCAGKYLSDEKTYAQRLVVYAVQE